MRVLSLLLVAALGLAACAPPAPTAQAPRPAPVESAASAPWQNRLMAAAGYDIPAARAVAQQEARSTANSLGLAVTGAAAGIGTLSPLASGGLGLITFLGAPPAGKEATDSLKLTAPATMSQAALEQQVQAAVYRLIGRDFEAEGHVKTPLPRKPHLHGFVQPGCKPKDGWYDRKCAVLHAPDLIPLGEFEQQIIYGGWIGGESGAGFFYPVDPSVDPDAALVPRKALADALPGRVHVYVAPRRTGGAWTRPALYSRGKLLPL